MFSEMISLLRQGKIPDGEALRRRMDASVIKKGGILQQPKNCWSGDPKINPLAVHMLWAAVLLEDLERAAMVVGMIEAELAAGIKPVELGEFIKEKMAELAALPADPEAVNLLRAKIDKASAVLAMGL